MALQNNLLVARYYSVYWHSNTRRQVFPGKVFLSNIPKGKSNFLNTSNVLPKGIAMPCTSSYANR